MKPSPRVCVGFLLPLIKTRLTQQAKIKTKTSGAWIFHHFKPRGLMKQAKLKKTPGFILEGV